MGDLICLDSHILIWGISEYATSGQELMIDKTKRFLKWLDNRKATILVPTVVVAEFLMNVPPEHHATITNLLDRSFVIAPFDTVAAAYFSKIWQTKKDQGIIDEARRDGKTRELIKVDGMLVATAVARKAKIIYSYDNKGVCKFAEGFIEVAEIPDIPEQQNLF
jgi:predicted nucleic acid-binding protein